MGRASLSERDVHLMLAITRKFGDDGGEALPSKLLNELKSLIECDWLAAIGQDTPRRECFADQQLPTIAFSATQQAALEAAYATHYWTSTCSYPDRTGDIESVTRDSDLMPEGKYRNTGMYRDYDRGAWRMSCACASMPAGRSGLCGCCSLAHPAPTSPDETSTCSPCCARTCRPPTSVSKDEGMGRSR